MASDPEEALSVAREERIERIFQRGLAGARKALDPERHLLGDPAPWAGGKKVFRPARSLSLAHALLRGSTVRGATEPDVPDAEDVREAALIVAAALDSQERDQGHPHRGNFRWLADDEEVGDLNAVQFVLRALLPLLIDSGHRWLPYLLARCRDA